MPQYSYSPSLLGSGHLLEVCADHARITKGNKPAQIVNYADVKRARFFDISSPKRRSLGVELETGGRKFIAEYALFGPMNPDAETYMEGARTLLQTLQAKRPDLEILSGPGRRDQIFLFLFFCVIGLPIALLGMLFVSEQDARHVGLAMLALTLPIILMAWANRPWQRQLALNTADLRPIRPERKPKAAPPPPAVPWAGR